MNPKAGETAPEDIKGRRAKGETPVESLKREGAIARKQKLATQISVIKNLERK